MSGRKFGRNYPFNDYSDKMPDLCFQYDEYYKPNSKELPDPQVDPLIPYNAPLRKVGIAPVDLPIIVKRRDGSTQVLQAQASLYCSLDNPDAKGLNLSRLYLLMHEKIKDHLTMEALKGAVKELADKQESNSSYCKLRFKYPWIQEALRSIDETTGRKLRGHIGYDVELECRYSRTVIPKTCRVDQRIETENYKFFLTVKYIYSSTCPCSFELAYDARTKRQAAANAHSQRSILTVKIEFAPEKIVWIEDLVELCRQNIPTEVQVVVKRVDEQAFAELNGSNLLFAEDAVRIMFQALNIWVAEDKIRDFSIVAEHLESLHPWSAIAVTSLYEPKDIPLF